MASADYPYWDNLNSNDTSTNENHGGSWLYVAVIQVGYGNANDAIMNGSSRRPVSTENRCGSDFHRCNVGETITGFVYDFDYSDP